jgi:peptide/nickel transport system permease protein
VALFLFRKLARALLTLVACVTAVFFVLRLAGDPLASLLPDDSPQDVIDAYRVRFGLDRTLWDQYVSYLAAAVRGDLGLSFRDGRPVAEVVAERIPATLQLGLGALVLALATGVPMGVVAALNRNTAIDRLVMAAAVFGFAMPIFFLAILLVFVFAMQFRVLPSAGSDTWAHMILPVVVLAAATAGKVARYMRTAIVDILGQPYIRTATGKGLRRFAVIAAHALPNAAIPLITFLGFELGTLIGGAVVTETVFAWPGIGRLLVVSVGQRDLPVVQAIVLLVAATMVTASLLADIVLAWLDPRLRTALGSRGWASS